jgi:hypothetical protein
MENSATFELFRSCTNTTESKRRFPAASPHLAVANASRAIAIRMPTPVPAASGA